MKHETMPDSIFSKLLLKSKIDDDATLEVLGMNFSHNNWKAGFYLENDELFIDDFGYMEKGKWVQLEPTEKQRGLLVSRLKWAFSKMEQEELSRELYESEQLKDAIEYRKDPYSYNGVSRGDFY